MWQIAGVVILGMVMSILDTTIVNVALHTLGRDLHSSISEIQWVITGYLLSLAAVIPVTGWAARRFGAKRVYMTSLVLFTAGSALCATATTTTDAGAVPHPAGRRRRHDHAPGDADHGPGRRPQADRAGDADRLDAGDARPDPGAGGRRPDPAEPALVVDLPRERADRRDRLHRRLARSSPTPNPVRPASSTCSAWCCCRPARRRPSTGLSELGSGAEPGLGGRARPDPRRARAVGDLLPARAARRAPAAGRAPVRQQDLRGRLLDHLLARRGAVRRDDPGAALLPGGAPRERARDRPAGRSAGARDAAGDAGHRAADRTLRRRAPGARRA